MDYLSKSSKTSWWLCIFIMLFIFSPVLSTQETAQPGALYVIVLVVPIFIMALTNRLIRPSAINIYAILLFVFALFSTALSEIGNSRIGAFMKYLMLIVFFISTSAIVFTPKQLKFSFQSYLGLSIALSILIILSYIFGYPHTASEYYQGRYSIGITGVYKNPNYLTSFYNIAFFVICYILATVKLTFNKRIVLYSILALFMISSFFTGTRAALLVEIMIILAVPMIMAKKGRLYMIIPLAIIIIAVITFLWTTIIDLYDLFMGSRDLLGDAGRQEAWSQAFKYIKESPILGCGHNSWYNIHGTSFLEWLHNVFLELLLDQGIIGVMLLYGIMVTGFKKTNSNDKAFLLLFLVFSSIPMFFQNGLYEVHFWRYIIINRLLMNFSESYEGGISAFLDHAFGSMPARRRVMEVREVVETAK